MMMFLVACSMGFTLGISGAIQPGPLMAVVLGESIRGGWRHGIRFGLIPLLTDPVMIFMALFVVSALPDWALGVISLAGAAVLIRLGINGLKQDTSLAEASKQPKTFGMAVAMNFLNPNLYIYAFTVHSVMLLRYWQAGIAAVVGYVFFFFAAMAAVNSVIAIFGGFLQRTSLPTRFLTALTRMLSGFLFAIAALFIGRGLVYFINEFTRL